GVRARAWRVQGRERGAAAVGGRWGEGGRAGRDHDRGQRAGARRRRAAVHDAAPAARRRLNGLAAVSSSSLSGRALAYLEAGPASSLVLAREVLGLARAPRAIAERVATTLVGADPRVSRLPDGRWTLAAAAASPGLDACRFAVVDVAATGTSPRPGDRTIGRAVAGPPPLPPAGGAATPPGPRVAQSRHPGAVLRDRDRAPPPGGPGRDGRGQDPAAAGGDREGAGGGDAGGPWTNAERGTRNAERKA